MSNNKDRFLSNTQWIYQIPNSDIICSHAGISKVWLKSVEEYLVRERGSQYEGTEIVLDLINTIEPCELFGFTANRVSDYCGESPTQPCTWIRPHTLLHHGIDTVIQVVGHTPVKTIANFKDEIIQTRQKLGFTQNSDVIDDYSSIWGCDCLENGEYLVIEDGKFKPCKIE